MDEVEEDHAHHDHSHEQPTAEQPTAEQVEELRAKREKGSDPNRLGNSYSSALNIWIGRQREAMAEIRRLTDALDETAQLIESGKPEEALTEARKALE